MASQSELAYQQIKEMIFQMELLPGDRVPESQIAAKLSISRTPIHDALRKLEAEGLVILEHNRGAAVVQFTDEEIKQIGTLRLSQDILSIQLATYYGCASDFERLLVLADECEAAAAKGDVYGRIQKDMKFHLELAKLSKNPYLLSQQYAIYQQIYLIQISQYTDVANSLLQIHHHRPIVAAVRSGDLEGAKKLTCQHVKDFYRIDPYVLKCYGGD